MEYDYVKDITMKYLLYKIIDDVRIDVCASNDLDMLVKISNGLIEKYKNSNNHCIIAIYNIDKNIIEVKYDSEFDVS